MTLASQCETYVQPLLKRTWDEMRGNDLFRLRNSYPDSMFKGYLLWNYPPLCRKRHSTVRLEDVPSR